MVRARTRGTLTAVSRFSVFSEHGQALILIAQKPGVPSRDMADTVGVSERKMQRIISDLVSAGLITRAREGRRATLGMDPRLRASLLALHVYDIGDVAGTSGLQSRKDAIVARLLTAMEGILLIDRGFTSLPVESLIKAAGISRSTFYANFQDKDDLLIALMESVAEGLQAAARTWTDLGSGLSKDDILMAMRQIGDARHPHRLVINAASQSESTKVQAYYRALMARSAAMVRDHVVRGQGGGFIRQDVDPVATSWLLTWGTEYRFNKLAMTDTGDKEIQHVVDSLADLIWNLLYAGVKQ